MNNIIFVYKIKKNIIEHIRLSDKFLKFDSNFFLKLIVIRKVLHLNHFEVL